MTDPQLLEQAKAVFSTICQTFDDCKWDYRKNTEELSIEIHFTGGCMPLAILVRVDAEQGAVTVSSKLPFDVPPEVRAEVGVAVNTINTRLHNGCFRYHLTTGEIHWWLTCSFLGCVFGSETVRYAIGIACETMEIFNIALLAMTQGALTLEQFLAEMDDQGGSNDG